MQNLAPKASYSPRYFLCPVELIPYLCGLNLRPIQVKILGYIVAVWGGYAYNHQYKVSVPISIDEIKKAIKNKSTRAIVAAVKSLVESGYIEATTKRGKKTKYKVKDIMLFPYHAPSKR